MARFQNDFEAQWGAVRPLNGARRLVGAAAATLALALFPSIASAQGTITSPTTGGPPGQATSFTVGLDEDGTLFDGVGIGFRRTVVGAPSNVYDPILPGSPRDSWGISSSAGVAYADPASFGTFGVTSTSVFTPSSAVFTSTTTAGLEVLQSFSFAAPNIVQIEITLTNVSGVALDDVFFQRNVDWDIAPTEFAERTFADPVTLANVSDATFNGFEGPDPSVGAFFSSCLAGCDNVGDNGAGIRVSFGTIEIDEFAKVTFYYGISDLNQDVGALLAQFNAGPSEYVIASESSENVDFDEPGLNAAFLAVGDIELSQAVPAPALASGLPSILGAGWVLWIAYRRRRRVSNDATVA